VDLQQISPSPRYRHTQSCRSPRVVSKPLRANFANEILEKRKAVFDSFDVGNLTFPD
jgi:hypothetical protein